MFSMKVNPMEKKPTYESAAARLEEIVRMLESGAATLDESLSLYEEGVKLLKVCHGQLENARRKVQLLTGVDEQGNPVLEDMVDDERSLDENSETHGR